MLVFKQSEGDTFTIGKNIKIHLLGIQGKEVKFGIDAPSEMPIHRDGWKQKTETKTLPGESQQ